MQAAVFVAVFLMQVYKVQLDQKLLLISKIC